MESRPAEVERRSLHEDAKRMSAGQRLAEFLSHCRLMAQLANSEAAASTRLETQNRRMRASAPGQSALLVADDAPVSAAWMHGGRVRGAGGSAVPWRHVPGQPGQCTSCRKDMSIESTDA